MGFGRIATDNQYGFAVMDIVVGVGHGAVTPGIGYARDRGRVTDTRLVVTIVSAPQRVELAEQIGLLVVEFGRSQPVHRVWARLLANLQHLVANLVNSVVPTHALPFAIHQLGRVLEPTLAMAMFPRSGTLGAVRAEVKRVVESRFLAHPHAVVYLGVDAATH